MKKPLFLLLTGCCLLTRMFGQDCSTQDPDKYREALKSVRALNEKNETEEFYKQSYPLLLCANTVLSSMTDAGKKEELRNLVGQIWSDRAVVSGRKGLSEAAIYNRSCALSYGVNKDADACKLFQEGMIHNRFNIPLVPSMGKCVSGDCLQGWGKYVFNNGATYEGEWLNGLMAGTGNYMSGTGYVYWSRHWKLANPDYDPPAEVPAVDGYPFFGPVLFGHTGTSTQDPLRTFENGVLTLDNAVQGKQDNYVFTAGLPVYDDFEVEVTIHIKDGPLTQGNGLVFRSWNNVFYLFNVTGDGRTAFYTCTPSEWQWHKLVEGQTSGKTAHPAVKTNAPNTLKVIAKGGNLQLLMNGQSLGSFTEPLQLRGNLGVYVSANNVVSYSDFKIVPVR